MENTIYITFGEGNMDELIEAISSTHIKISILENDGDGATILLEGPQSEVDQILEMFSYE